MTAPSSICSRQLAPDYQRQWSSSSWSSWWFSCHLASNRHWAKAQWTHHVETTSIQRWFNVLTLNQRWIDAVSKLFAAGNYALFHHGVCDYYVFRCDVSVIRQKIICKPDMFVIWEACIGVLGIRDICFFLFPGIWDISYFRSRDMGYCD